MVYSEKDIYLQETEIKPNRYAAIVLTCCVVFITVCFALNEIGIFRVGKSEMRIGTVITTIVSALPLSMLIFNKKAKSNRNTKYFVIIASSIYTFAVGSLLTFHTTIMLLFPMFFAMLYRSKSVGILAATSSIMCSIFSPIFGYLIGAWDIELFRELILIGTNGTAVIEGAYDGVSLLNVGKILLYLVLPHLMMVGSASILMFYIIRIGGDHVNNQILLNKLSHRDAVTSLYNQNYYNEILRQPKNEGNVGVIFFDVNYLKLTNDTYGHEYGDMLLKRCAQSILNVCDEVNTFGFRLGGDEFVILVEDANEKAVTEKIAEWQRSVETINAENVTEYNGIVCSLAYGYSFGKISELESLTQIADERMYSHKARMKAEDTCRT
ncbi:MAG: GGDEF domain-containing protein [Clostridia bacterium]|nr:GGDEF domain-containing protein [Clostridia bacterium]